MTGCWQTRRLGAAYGETPYTPGEQRQAHAPTARDATVARSSFEAHCTLCSRPVSVCPYHVGYTAVHEVVRAARHLRHMMPPLQEECQNLLKATETQHHHRRHTLQVLHTGARRMGERCRWSHAEPEPRGYGTATPCGCLVYNAASANMIGGCRWWTRRAALPRTIVDLPRTGKVLVDSGEARPLDRTRITGLQKTVCRQTNGHTVVMQLAWGLD